MGEISELVTQAEKMGFVVKKVETEDIQLIGQLLAAGYSVENPETSTQYTLEGKTVNKVKLEAPKQEEMKETKTEVEATNDTLQFVMGTPTETTKDNGELSEDKILAMTPEQVIENIDKIRDFTLANGGLAVGN